MVRSIWKRALVTTFAWASLAWAQQPIPSTGPAANPGESTGQTFTVQEAGKVGQKCKILKSWKTPEGKTAYQVQAMDILGFLDQFGLEKPILVGERLGSVAAVLLAAWHPGRVARLVLIDATYVAQGSSPEARSLKDCPPDWPSIRGAVQCPIVEVRWDSATVDNLKQYLQIP